MRYLLTSEQMKTIDACTITQVGVPSMVLMERAALAVAERAWKLAGPGTVFWCLCGSGNNGADGVAAGRILWLKGARVRVVLAGQPGKGTTELKSQIQIGENLGMEFVQAEDFLQGKQTPQEKDVVIDALFGIGLSREIQGIYGECVDQINRMRQEKRLRVVSVDIPSGIHGDTGQIMGRAVQADVTVTFGWEKRGTLLYPGREAAGKTEIAQIGFAPSAFQTLAGEAGTEGGERLACTYEERDLSRIPSRKAYSNKGTFGKVLIAAGSKGMCGAAYLSALAAYRTGAGLVKILTVEENRQILQNLLPEAILAVYTADQLMEGREDFRKMISQQCQWADVVVLGPGLGTEPYVEYLVEDILTSACSPVILDADGLNTVAAHPYLTAYYTDNVIITPHLGEMARLTGQTIQEIQVNLVQTAAQYADRYGLTCILKDAATVAVSPGGEIYINSSGSSAMAKAGSGDVLTGILAGLLALGLDETESARLGVYLHGFCGQLAEERLGSHNVLASDLTRFLGQAMEKRESCKEDGNA